MDLRAIAPANAAQYQGHPPSRNKARNMIRRNRSACNAYSHSANRDPRQERANPRDQNRVPPCKNPAARIPPARIPSAAATAHNLSDPGHRSAIAMPAANPARIHNVGKFIRRSEARLSSASCVLFGAFTGAPTHANTLRGCEIFVEIRTWGIGIKKEAATHCGGYKAAFKNASGGERESRDVQPRLRNRTTVSI
jgi:hypothetical protein